MSLPTSYPGNLVPTSGQLTILPRFPTVDEVVLKSEISQYVSPPPTQLIASAKLVSPIGLPGGASLFPLDVTFPTTSNVEYDIQIRGVMSYVSGTTTPTDTIFFTLSVGGAAGTWVYGAQPYGLGGTGNFQIRDRLISGAPLSNVTLTAYNTQINPSTARYQVSLQQFDINEL